MELTNEFRVGASPDEAWAVLTDLERIAPCMPGAELQEVDGDDYKGVVKIKVGPITANYKGVARFVERDDATHRAVLQAEGRETRGQGNASAKITAQLSPDGDGTLVSVITDLTIAGRVAQFGRGILADVSTKLLGQFADCLGAKLDGGSGSGDADEGSSAGTSTADGGSGVGASTASASSSAGSSSSAGGSSSSASSTEPIDLLEVAGAPGAKRIVTAGVAVTTFLWLARLFLRRRRSKKARRAA
jgi:carbon monoxide dehydrogenase subunit G